MSYVINKSRKVRHTYLQAFNMLCPALKFILASLHLRGLQIAIFMTLLMARIDSSDVWGVVINPLKPELNPICYLLALLGAHHFLHVSRIRVKLLTFRLLMS